MMAERSRTGRIIEFLERLTEFPVEDPDKARRGRFLNIFILIAVGITVLFIVNDANLYISGERGDARSLVADVVALLWWLGLFFWLRVSRLVEWVAFLFSFSLTAAVTLVLPLNDLLGGPFIMGVVPSVIILSTTHRPASGFLAAVLAIFILAARAMAEQSDLTLVMIASLFLLGVSGAVWLLAYGLTTLAQEALAAQARAEARSRQLEEILKELRMASDKERQLLDTIRKIAVPVIPILPEVLLLPLTGHLDLERAQQVNHDLLHAIAVRRPRLTLIDLTGVPVPEQGAIEQLVKTIQAARILGTEVALVGMETEVARRLAEQEIDLADVRTLGDLQAGVEYALSLSGRRIAAAQ